MGLEQLTADQRQRVEKQLNLHANIKQPYRATIKLGPFARLRKVWVYPEVMAPDLMNSSQVLARWLWENRKLLKGKSFLDMGSGTGIQSLVARKCGAWPIVATDVSKDAFFNMLMNLNETYGVYSSNKPFTFPDRKEQVYTVRMGDLFEKVPYLKYDIIAFNHPYFPADPEPGVKVSATMLDSGNLLQRFLKEAKNYLALNGKIITTFFHPAGETNDPKNHAASYGYKIEEVSRQNVQSGELQHGLFSVYVLERQ